MRYKNELKIVMEYIDRNFDNALFLGQSVCFEGTAMYHTLIDIDNNKKIELPIIEDSQIGFCTGLSINGFLPISIIPRINFLLCAMDQIVNHLNCLSTMSSGGFNPKVIIRTANGSERPLDPQIQHKGRFANAIKKMVPNINVIELHETKDIFPSYKRALESDKSTILVEFADYYNEK